jgi:colicin import membrane protein
MAHALRLGNIPDDDRTALLVSVGVHAGLLFLMLLNLDLVPRPAPKPARLAIEATVVDAGAIRRAAEAERAARQAEEQRRRQEAARRREAEQQRAAEEQARRRQAEEQRREREQAEVRRREETKRRQEADKAQKAKAEQQRRQAEERKRAEADAKRKADAEASRKAEAARREAQSRADLERAMAEEEQLSAAAESGLLDQYAEVIRQKVERNWIRPASAREGIRCVVLVKQIPGGEVVEVRVAECNGDAAVVRSIEAAVLRSSPLPAPPDPALFDRSLRFEFRPRD